MDVWQGSLLGAPLEELELSAPLFFTKNTFSTHIKCLVGLLRRLELKPYQTARKSACVARIMIGGWYGWPWPRRRALAHFSKGPCDVSSYLFTLSSQRCRQTQTRSRLAADHDLLRSRRRFFRGSPDTP